MDHREAGRCWDVNAEAWTRLSRLGYDTYRDAFDTPHRKNLRDAGGRTYALEVGNYFQRRDGDVAEWTFSSAPREMKERERPFQTPCFTRPLGEWINLLISTGFRIERLAEPAPNDDAVRRYPNVQDAQVVAYFLHVRVRKPA